MVVTQLTAGHIIALYAVTANKFSYPSQMRRQFNANRHCNSQFIVIPPGKGPVQTLLTVDGRQRRREGQTAAIQPTAQPGCPGQVAHIGEQAIGYVDGRSGVVPQPAGPVQAWGRLVKAVLKELLLVRGQGVV